jgi:cytochrome c oxidase subunit 1
MSFSLDSGCASEWQAPSPPGHGNFTTPPVVHRWPYDYNLPGASKDWVAQTTAEA